MRHNAARRPAGDGPYLFYYTRIVTVHHGECFPRWTAAEQAVDRQNCCTMATLTAAAVAAAAGAVRAGAARTWEAIRPGERPWVPR